MTANAFNWRDPSFREWTRDPAFRPHGSRGKVTSESKQHRQVPVGAAPLAGSLLRKEK